MQSTDNKIRIVTVAGPTASGKTALAVALAKRLNGEVISADSMQVYAEPRIGTARPDESEMAGIPHHLLGFVGFRQLYSINQQVVLLLYQKLPRFALKIQPHER